MPCQLSWLVEDRVLLCYQWGTFSRTDFWALLEDIRVTLMGSPVPIHIIQDVLNLQRSDICVDDLHGFVSTHVENIGWLVVLSDGRFEKLIVSLASQLLCLRSNAVKSPQETSAYLMKLDRTLPEFIC
jgi:hypothetical protein